VRRAHRQLRPLVVEQEDDHRVGGHGLPDATEELREEVVQAQVRESRVRHALHGPDLVGRRLERQARALLAGGEGLRARLGAAQHAAYGADDQRFESEDAQAGDRRSAQRGAAGGGAHEGVRADDRADDGGQQPGPDAPVPRAEHDRAEVEREIAAIDVRLEREGQEPREARRARGEHVFPEGRGGRMARRCAAGSRRSVYRGT
jgi:hypothetical protein